jgi:DNA-binding CsgD family transcriptional regulator
MRRKHSHELAQLRELCSLPLPAELLMPELLAALHRLVPSQRNLFDWCDAQGRLTHYLIEGPVDAGIAAHYFEEFHNRREAEAMPSFAQALASGQTLLGSAALNQRAFFDSALYQAIWQPQGLRYRVECIVRGPRGAPLGSLVLYRGPGERCFTPTEEARLLPLLPHLAGALQRGPLHDAAHWVPAPEPPETLLLDPNGTPRHASPGALALLLRALEGLSPLTLKLDLAQHPQWRSLLLALAQGPVRQRLASPQGLFELHAQPLQALQSAPRQRWLQLQLQRLEPALLAQERRLQRLDLPTGQRTVCRLLLAGETQADIARQMGVAASTVVDHTRKLYARLGVRSLLELRERVNAG